MAFIRRVRTASGATAVQIAEYSGGRQRIVKHVGSAHTEAELGMLLEQAGGLLADPAQGELDLGVEPTPRVTPLVAAVGDRGLFEVAPGSSATPSEQRDGPGRVVGTDSRLLFEALASVFTALGFDGLGDAVFRDRVIARVVEPTSLLDAGRAPASYATMKRTLGRAKPGSYRDQIATLCFQHASTSGDISLVLYDVTTLYFEAEKEDDLRKVGYSKERRVDPQIVVVVADAGMLSANNLRELDEADLRFIVGSRVTKAPIDLASHFRWHGDAFTDGQLIDTITPRTGHKIENNPKIKAEPAWNPEQHPGSWRAVWAYSTKRAVRDNKTLSLQENRARAVVAGEQAARAPRFVKTNNGAKALDETSLARARRLVGLKGYVTNIPAGLMPVGEVIASYHELWHVERLCRRAEKSGNLPTRDPLPDRCDRGLRWRC